MALAFPLPKRIIEDFYNSEVVLKVHDDTKTAVGMYQPPSKMSNIMETDMSIVTPGVSVLRGSLTMEDDGVMFAGTWEHIDGPMGTGVFQMKINLKGQGVGWWAEVDPSYKIDCENPAASAAAIHKYEPKSLEKKMPVKNLWTWSSGKKVANEKILDIIDLVYQKNAVFSAYLFLVMTVTSLLLAMNVQEWGTEILFGATAEIALNYIFNIIYTLICFSFMVSYYFLRVRPMGSYIAGVLLYTVGYATFAMYYGLHAHHFESVFWSDFMYTTGALNFLLGSALLAYATIPQSLLKDSSLFYGASNFIIGSVFFTIDALKFPEPANVPNFVVLGYFFFVGGRICFVYSCLGSEWGLGTLLSLCYGNTPPMNKDLSEGLLSSGSLMESESHVQGSGGLRMDMSRASEDEVEPHVNYIR